MSATEVIELIKKLPPEEQAVVRDFVTTQPVGITLPEADGDSAKTERAIAIGRAYIDRHSELFRKLAE